MQKKAGLSKPNILYYFNGKESINVVLLSQLLDTWLTPLRELDPQVAPNKELMRYIRRKLKMSREYPSESRLFENEIVQGAPRIEGFLKGELRELVDEKAKTIDKWIKAGKLQKPDLHLMIFSTWAITQHYADFYE